MRNYIYVDNSNLFIEGQRTSAVKQKHAATIVDAMNKGILNFSWNLDYGSLYEIVCGNRAEVARAFMGQSSTWRFILGDG